MANLKLNDTAIAHDPEGTFIGVITGSRRYARPTDKVPGIVRALRACADGDQAPADCSNMVFANGGHVALTDKPVKISAMWRSQTGGPGPRRPQSGSGTARR